MQSGHFDSARPPPGPTPLTKLGPYEILTKLAPGPVATSYLSRKMKDTAPGGGLYVLSVLHDDLGTYGWLVERLLAEVTQSARIAHPNVEVIADFGTIDNHSFVATRFFEGATLSQLMSRQGETPVRVIVPMMVDVLHGLHAAHSQRDERGSPLPIVHSGVAPASVFVGLDGVTRVTEFGIARVQMRTTQTMPGVRSDRFAHLSPEQIGQSGEIDQRADIFAVGTVLWSALTGRSLFRAADAVATMRQVLHMEVPSPKTLRGDVPPWLEEICLRALQRAPHLRFPNAEQMAFALEERAQKNKLWATRAEIAEWARRTLAAPPKRGDAFGTAPTMVSMSFEAAQASSGPRERLTDTGGRSETMAAPATLRDPPRSGEGKGNRKALLWGGLGVLLLGGGAAVALRGRLLPPSPSPTLVSPVTSVVSSPEPALSAALVQSPPAAVAPAEGPSPTPTVAPLAASDNAVPSTAPANALPSTAPANAAHTSSPLASVPKGATGAASANIAAPVSPSPKTVLASPLPRPGIAKPAVAPVTAPASHPSASPPAPADPGKALPTVESNPYLRRTH